MNEAKIPNYQENHICQIVITPQFEKPIVNGSIIPFIYTYI